MPAVVAIVGGSLFLHIFFRAVEAGWPEKYFGQDAAAEYRISANPLRYVLFRFGPVYLTALFVTVSVDRAGGDPAIACVGVVLVHAFVSSLLGFAAGVRHRATRRREALLLLRAVVSVGVLIAGVLAFLTRNVFHVVVPPLSEVTFSLWTAVLAAVLGVYLTQVSMARGGTTVYDLLERSRKSIDKSLWKMAEELAATHGTDVHLLRAVMVVENLQRPAWFRRIERLISPILHEGTYGIMQIQSQRWLSDEESLQLAAAGPLAERTVRRLRNEYDGDFETDFEHVKEIAYEYNPDKEFADLVQTVYIQLAPD